MTTNPVLRCGVEEMGQYYSTKAMVDRSTLEINAKLRKIDRDIMVYEREKDALRIDMEKYAKENNVAMLRATARNFMNYERFVTKLTKVKGDMMANRLNLRLMYSRQEMTEAMSTMSDSMQSMNASMDPGRVSEIMASYETQKMTSEMTGDLVDQALGDEEYDEETETELITSVLDKAGVEVGPELLESLNATPSVASLERRLQNF